MKKELSEEERLDNQILDLLMKKGVKSANDISNTFNKMYGKIVQRLIDEEFKQFMEYDKGSHEQKRIQIEEMEVLLKARKLKQIMGK